MVVAKILHKFHPGPWGFMIHEMFFKWVELNHLEEEEFITPRKMHLGIYIDEEFFSGEDNPARYHGIWVKYI